jgi:uncharacterized UBP type Zn finger protein
MTTDPIEVIRGALESWQHVKAISIQGEIYQHENIGVTQALAALETVKDNYLPEPPKGWSIHSMFNIGHEWHCALRYMFNARFATGQAVTPSAAFLAAVKAIGE